jgi:hypothetical protein
MMRTHNGGEKDPVIFPAFKAVLSTVHVTAPRRSTTKIAFISLAFGDSSRAAPRTTAKQNEKPTDTTVAPVCYAKQVVPECGRGKNQQLGNRSTALDLDLSGSG